MLLAPPSLVLAVVKPLTREARPRAKFSNVGRTPAPGRIKIALSRAFQPLVFPLIQELVPRIGTLVSLGQLVVVLLEQRCCEDGEPVGVGLHVINEVRSVRSRVVIIIRHMHQLIISLGIQVGLMTSAAACPCRNPWHP